MWYQGRVTHKDDETVTIRYSNGTYCSTDTDGFEVGDKVSLKVQVSHKVVGGTVECIVNNSRAKRQRLARQGGK